MLGVDGAAADVDRRSMDLADVEQIQRHAGAHDIGDGIHRADFVEVNFFDRHAVDAGFGVAQAAKHIRRILFGAIGERSLVDHRQDVFQMAVAVAVTIAFLGRNHTEFRGGDAAAAGLLHFKLRAGIQALQRVDQGPGGCARVQQRADRHVPADAGKRVEVSDSHSLIIGAFQKHRAYPRVLVLEDEKDIEYLRLYF